MYFKEFNASASTAAPANSLGPCGPSRASLLTGLYTQNHGSVRNGTPLAADTNNIAKIVREAGYDPTLFGYTDTSLDPRDISDDDPRLRYFEGVLDGFSIGAEHNDGNLDAWIQWIKAQGETIENEGDLYRSIDGYKDGFHRQSASYSAAHSDSAFLVSKTIEHIDSYANQPWFVHLSFLRPHPPWIAPEPYNTLLASDAIALPTRHHGRSQEAAVHPFIEAWFAELDQPGKITHDLNIQQISEDEREMISCVYYGLLAEVDAQLGVLIQHLKETGQYDQTLIVLTADHGEQLGDHWLWGKGGFYDSSYHIPLIVRDPYQLSTHGYREIQAFTASIDIMPTILEWLDITVPEDISGQSLWPCIAKTESSQNRQQIIWEYDFRNVSNLFYEQKLNLSPDQCNLTVIRDHNYKYVHFNQGDSLLFDLQVDPGELNNLEDNADSIALRLHYCSRLLSHQMLNHTRSLRNHLLNS